MPPEIIAVLGTLFGALVGGLINYLSSRSVKNHEWRLSLAKDQAVSRQKLYAEFLVEAQRLVMQAHEEKISSLSDLNALNGKFAEVSLVAPDSVVEAAKKLTVHSPPIPNIFYIYIWFINFSSSPNLVRYKHKTCNCNWAFSSATFLSNCADGILSAVCNCCSTPHSNPCVLTRLPSLSKHIFCRYLNKVASVCSSAQKPAKASLVVRLLHSATIRYCW